jgi:hypothetical protein
MNFTQIRFAQSHLTLADLQNQVRVAEAGGRALLAISRLDRQGFPRMTAVTFEFADTPPTPELTLIAYDGITLPDLGGRTAICIGQCIIEDKDSNVVATR